MKYVTVSLALIAAVVGANAYAADTVGKTRAQVQAELAEAQRTGDIMANKDAGVPGATLYDLNPSAYPARAAAPVKTRAQVLAELAEAQRTGDIAASKDMALDDSRSAAGHKLNEVDPAAYPAKAAAPGKTRAQVLAELAEAQRTGDIAASKDMALDDSRSAQGFKLNEVYPSLYRQTQSN